MAGKFVGTIYTGDLTNEAVTGTAAEEIIYGFGGSDTLKGGAGDDEVSGSGASYLDSEQFRDIDKVYGGSGDDFLINAAMAPKGAVIDGGEGTDTARLVTGILGGSSSATKKIAFTLASNGSYVTVDGKPGLFVTGAEKLDFQGSGQLALTGGQADDRVSSFSDNAVLKGLGGNDTLYAGSGATLDGGAGNDDLRADLELQFKATAIGGSGLSDHLDLRNGNNLALTMNGDAGKGMTVLSGGTTLATISGIESITAYGSTKDDTLLGAIGDDTITGYSGGKDTIKTGAGDDSITATLDKLVDTIDAGAGSGDSIALSVEYFGSSYAKDAVVMTGSIGSFTVKLGSATAATVKGIEQIAVNAGGNSDDKLFGGALDDRLSVFGGADEVKAGDGQDYIRAYLDKGFDRLDGGAGNLDTLDLWLADRTQAVSMSKSGTSLDLMQDGKVAVRATNMESLLFTGSNLADKLLGLSGFDRLLGGAGDDKIYGFGGDDALTGGAGRDTLDGGDGNDTLVAGNGTVIIGGVSGPGALGTDTLIGGAGIDTASFTDLSLPGIPSQLLTSGVTATLVAGTTVKATVGKTAVATLSGIENLGGSAYNDTLTGDKTDNVLTGYGGKNVLDGGAGNDTVDYSWLDATVFLSITMKDKGGLAVTEQIAFGQTFQHFQDTLRGIESLTGSQGGDTMTGNKFDNVLRGERGDDILKGGGGNDTLEGGLGADTLDGGDGNDTLSDLDGSARMTGGAGRDTFSFNFTPGVPTGASPTIRSIKDFNVKDDTLSLSALSYGLNATKPGAHLSDKVFKGGGLKGAKLDGDDRLIYDSKTGNLYYDADGARTDATAVKIANFENHAALTAADFIVV